MSKLTKRKKLSFAEYKSKKPKGTYKKYVKKYSK